MKIKSLYYILFLLISNVWLAEASYNLKDLKGLTDISLKSSNIFNTSIAIEVDDYMLIDLDNNKFKVFIDQGTSIMEAGSPDLPQLSTSIIIPDKSKMIINVSNSEYVDYNNVNIAPSKGNLTRDINPASVPFTYNNSYKENKFFPGELTKLSDPYVIRDLRGQTVNFYPIQYNPVTKVLRVYSKIDVEIISDNEIGNNILTRRSNSIKTNNEFMHIYDDLFINSNNDTRFEYLSDQGSMLIICYDDFIDEMQPFVDWKNRKGILTEIVGLNEVGASTTSIQNYVNNYYYENNLTYLLLVGDINQIPTHIVNGAASDPTFGFINGNDSFAEVIVGRFSANNPSELQTQIDRTLTYEINPEFVDHLDKAIGVGSTQGPGYGGLSDDEFNDLLWNDFLSLYTYESFEGIYDGGGSVQQAVNAINEGVGLINYTGHAGPTGWGNGAPLSNNDVDNLQNAGKLPFIFTVGCNPGEFNNYGASFCEAWLRATDENGNPTGAVGHLGSTISQSWEPPMHGQWAMNSILTESYENNISRSYGGIIVNGCMHMNEAQGSAGINETNHWTIFGDPSLLIRTDEPVNINAQYNETIFVGEEQFVVDVGINGALVSLSRNNELLSSAYSNGGVAVLDLGNVSNEPGQVDLIITSFNTNTHISTLNVIVPDGAFIVFDSYNLLGNNNQAIEYGQTVSMNLNVENVGTMNANAINVSVSSADEYINMIDDNSMIAYSIIDQIATTEEPISFSVTNSVPDGHLASFEVLLDNGDYQWSFNFSVEINAPVFEILNPVLTDDNQDSIWDAGESATISLDLVNSGSAPFGYYPGATISTANPYVTIISGENDNTFYAIDSNASYEGQFIVLADPSTPMGTVVEFNISWGYSPTAPCDNEYFIAEGCVEQANLIYSAIIGHPSILIWDPSSNHTSGERMVSYFDGIGFNGYDYVSSTDVPNLENYMTAFVFLGIYPNNFVIQESVASLFAEMLNNGKNVYLEGGDTWAFDMSTSLHSMFGIDIIASSDGTSDLGSLIGSNNSFAEGYSFTYDGGNNYIDQLIPAEGYSLLENDISEYITAVAYENILSSYKTIGASHELGGLQGDDFNNYIDGILNFFNHNEDNIEPPECVSGDVNSDNTLDVLDIIRLVNIIINSGLPASDQEICASDANYDGQLNILDILLIVNLILD